MKIIRVLCGDMLLLDNITEDDYEYSHEPDTIGIATKNSDGKKHYYVYETNERGYFDWIEEKDTFNEALLFAREMYKGMLKAYYYMSMNYKNSNEELEKQAYEEIIQEIFRQIIIKEGTALDYALLHEDDFKFEENGHGVSGMIYILKDDNGIWNVWEAIYESGVYDNIRSFDNQIDAYIDAAKRRGINLRQEDFNYDINNTDDMLNIIEGAEDFLLAGINCYEGHSAKLEARYTLLNSFKKQLYLKDNAKKLSRKKGGNNDKKY